MSLATQRAWKDAFGDCACLALAGGTSLTCFHTKVVDGEHPFVLSLGPSKLTMTKTSMGGKGLSPSSFGRLASAKALGADGERSFYGYDGERAR